MVAFKITLQLELNLQPLGSRFEVLVEEPFSFCHNERIESLPGRTNPRRLRRGNHRSIRQFGDRICEVGLVRAQGDDILDTYQTLVNPGRPISPGAARVNGLTDDAGPPGALFSEIAPPVLAMLDGALLVCHNAPFDLSFLEAELARLGQPCQPLGVIDTLDIARRYFHFASNSLSAVASRLGLETPQAHRALGDALTTLQVFRHFYRQLAGRGVVQPADLVGTCRPAPALE